MGHIQSKEIQEGDVDYGIFLALHELLGLPDHITNLELNFFVDTYPLVTCTYELQEDGFPKIVNGKILTETKKYKIYAAHINNFIGDIVSILGEHPSYIEFKVSIKGGDEDIIVSSKSYLGDDPYKEKIKRLKEMETKSIVCLEEVK